MRKKLLFILFTASIIISIRFILFFLYAPHLQDGQHISFTTTLLSEPTRTSSVNSISVFYTNIFGGQQVQIKYEPTIAISYGEYISISGRVERKVTKTGTQYVSMYLPQIKIEVNQSKLLSLANYLRQNVKEIYVQALSKDDASLLLGVVFGIKGEFSKNFMLYLRSSGVLHVIAASGMNVTMVAGFLSSLAIKIFKRQYAILLVVGGILFYAVISGLQPSIMRATIMASFAFGAALLGRQYTGICAIFLTGFFMLFTKPELLFDIGFQLSILSTLGIMTIQPLFPKGKGLEDIWTTISAQIATLPILLINFGQYGLLSILVNALVLWTIPPLMIFGGIGAIMGLLFAPLGNTIISLSIPFLWFFETIVQYFGSLGWNLTIASFPREMVIGYYLVLLACSLKRFSKP